MKQFMMLQHEHRLCCLNYQRQMSPRAPIPAWSGPRPHEFGQWQQKICKRTSVSFHLSPQHAARNAVPGTIQRRTGICDSICQIIRHDHYFACQFLWCSCYFMFRSEGPWQQLVAPDDPYLLLCRRIVAGYLSGDIKITVVYATGKLNHLDNCS